MWKIIKWPLLYFLAQFLLVFIISYIYNMNGNDMNLFNEFLGNNQIYIVGIISLIFIPLLISEYKKYKKENNKSKIQISYLLLVGIIVSLIYNIFAYYMNDFIFKTNLFNENNHILITLLATGVLGPIIEELMFRGIIYNEFKNKFTNMQAILLTTTFFAIIHFNIFQMVYAFAIGFILIFVYEKYKTIKAPIILHMMSNITTALFLPILLKENIIINMIIFVICLIILYVLKRFTSFFKYKND